MIGTAKFRSPSRDTRTQSDQYHSLEDVEEENRYTIGIPTHPNALHCNMATKREKKPSALPTSSSMTRLISPTDPAVQTLLPELSFHFLSPCKQNSSRVRQPQPLLHRLHKNRRDSLVRSADGKTVHLKRRSRQQINKITSTPRRVKNIPYSQHSAPTATNTQTCLHSYAAP
jgi:hypothetical protein